MDKLTDQEIEEFKKLEDIQVVIDVGVRESIDYLELKPDATFHLFEPAPEIFKRLKEKIGNKTNIHLNNYGLGEVEKNSPYNKYLQAFMDGAARPGWGGDIDLPIKTLDWYIQEHNITRIDFLKIDTEGYDLKVLQGGKKAVALARYIQFEAWDNLEEIKAVLPGFTIKDLGARNYFCERR